MSRSKGSRRTSKRGQNIEYWSKRPFSNAHGAAPGKVIKKLTHQKERRIAERELRKDDG